MRKIDKSEILSTIYKKWEEGLEKNNQQHPKYDKTTRFYEDIVMNLYYCQNGLCAYTEQILADEELFDKKMSFPIFHNRYTSERLSIKSFS